MQKYLEPKVGADVVIVVTDIGMGIPAEIRDGIFEPFLTIKELSTGTGLGLATAIDIIKSHNGFVKVL